MKRGGAAFGRKERGGGGGCRSAKRSKELVLQRDAPRGARQQRVRVVGLLPHEPRRELRLDGGRKAIAAAILLWHSTRQLLHQRACRHRHRRRCGCCPTFTTGSGGGLCLHAD